MKKIIKRITMVLVIFLLIETGLLIREVYTYTKYKYANLTPNGRIVCQLDSWFNFSGMADE